MSVFDLVIAVVIFFTMGMAFRAALKFFFGRRKLMQARMESLMEERANPALRKAGSGSALNTPGVAGEAEEKLFSGTIGGINWELKSIILPGGRSTSSQVWNSKSIWKTGDVKWPEGKFLMVMSTPAGINTGNLTETGLFNKLIVFVADKMIDVYVAGYFSQEYTALVGIENNGKILQKEQAKGFFILTNQDLLAEKFLDDATLRAISTWREHQAGFQQESRVDLFGVLFAPDAMIVSCQAALREPEEVKMFSDFASAMAVKMRGCLN